MNKIVVVDMGYPGEELTREHGPFSAWFRRAMTPWLPAEAVGAVAVAEAQPRDFADAAGVIFSGAREGVYQPLSWRDHFDPIARTLVASGMPVLGVCFGHQYLATISGGKVEHAPEQIEEGVIRCRLTAAGCVDPLFRGLPDTVPFFASHGDMVVELPPDAVLLAGNEQVPVEAFRLAGTNARGVQFHPEMTPAISRSIIAGNYRENDPRRHHWLESLNDTEKGATIMANFLGMCGLV